MTSETKDRILNLIEFEAHAHPSPIEFEMAYQIRVVIDRIRSTIQHAEQFSKPCEQVREVSLQLLEALGRLESVDRRFQRRSRIASSSEPASGMRWNDAWADRPEGRSPP
jgi:hypothetical protein